MKLNQLYSLGEERKATKWEGYLNLGDFHDGGYESRFVSPFTKGAANAESDVFVLLQDWASSDFLNGPYDEELAKHGRKLELKTNRNLERLLAAHFGLSLKEVFATNLFPLIKMGKMNASIPLGAMTRAAREFALPQIEIVKPRLVIALGLSVFQSLQRAKGLEKSDLTAHAIENPFDHFGSRCWCQAHPGQMGTNTRNRIAPGQADRDWIQMRDWFDAG